MIYLHELRELLDEMERAVEDGTASELGAMMVGGHLREARRRLDRAVDLQKRGPDVVAREDAEKASWGPGFGA